MDRDPNMQGRRSASRATKLRRRKARMNFVIMAVLAALAVLLVLVTPKDPFRRATYSAATESGLVEDRGGEEIGAYDGLVISEVMASNAASVTDENGNYADWIEIWNSTGNAINLAGLGLSDKGDRIRFLFPDVSLEPDGRVVVFCDNIAVKALYDDLLLLRGVNDAVVGLKKRDVGTDAGIAIQVFLALLQ